MKILSTVVLISVIMSCSSCSKKTAALSEKPSTAATPAAAATADSANKDFYRFLVSFYSIGEGSEGKQIEMLEQFISDYRLKTKKNIPVDKTHWGREGEVNFCFKLTEFDAAGQQQFINEVIAILKTAKLVRFSENTSCGRNRR
ncbi:MAG: hypothetical protein NT126_06930 [Bacteroidetes bacterium]|nr:hypothetical protein [Bacteroidota bacterium]